MSDVSANVNEGSQEKLFTTEATARYGSWDALLSLWPANFSLENSMSQGFKHENLCQV